MAVEVELRADGRRIRGLPDPSGGSFTAAGDFDRFINEDYPGHPADLVLPVLGTVDTYGVTGMGSELMSGLLGDIATVLPLAKAGSSEMRGLLRLRVMAEWCASRPSASLIWTGD